MQVSQYEVTVVDPTWNVGRVKPNDNQLWSLDENGIRAKITGYCLYSSGDVNRKRDKVNQFQFAF